MRFGQGPNAKNQNVEFIKNRGRKRILSYYQSCLAASLNTIGMNR